MLAPGAGALAAVAAGRALGDSRRAYAVVAGLLTGLAVTWGVWFAGWAAGFGSCAETLG